MLKITPLLGVKGGPCPGMILLLGDATTFSFKCRAILAPKEGAGHSINFPATLAEIARQEAEGKDIEVWFQDEARIGQKNKITRRWSMRRFRERVLRTAAQVVISGRRVNLMIGEAFARSWQLLWDTPPAGRCTTHPLATAARAWVVSGGPSPPRVARSVRPACH